MKQKSIIQDQKEAFNDPSMSTKDLNILQINFTNNEIDSVDYLEIQIDGTKIVLISLK